MFTDEVSSADYQKLCKLLETIIAWAVSDEIEKLCKEKCCGYESDNPSQRRHDCLMLTVEKNGQRTVWKRWSVAEIMLTLV